MLLKKTTCLLLFGACSLFAPAEAGASYGSWEWNHNYSNTPDSADPKSIIASDNTETITEGTYNGVVFGYAEYSTTDAVENVKASSNEGSIESGVTIKQKVCGGLAFYSGTAQDMTVQANGNKVSFKNGSSFVITESGSILNGSGIFGGHARVNNEGVVSTGEANGNEVYIESGVSLNSTGTNLSGINIYGGVAMVDYEGDSTASNNRVTVENPSIDEGCYIVGGRAETLTFAADDDATASACKNEVSVTGGKIRTVEGGIASSSSASAEGNKVVLNDVKLEQGVIGGGASSLVSATANNNTVVLNGGTCTGQINGGWVYVQLLDTCEAVNNRIELRNGTAGAPDFAGIATLYGGYTDGTSTGNSLNFYDVKGMKAGNIGYFQILNYDYSEMHAGDVILELKGTDTEENTSIANAEVNVSVVNLYGEDGQSEFKTGDKVVLLKNDNGLETEGISTKAVITAETGISLTYEVEVQANEKELYLTRTGTKSTVLPGTKAIAEGAAAGLALASESSNATMEFLRDFSVSGGSITPFVHTQASSMRHETGSSINMSTVSLLAGLGTGIDTGAGNLSLGAFFEYGKGSYTTNNSFDNRSDIDGDGNSWYMGGGILAKMEFLQTGPGHFYLEGSAHMGTLHNEYDSNDLYDANGNVAKFDMDSPYYSLHGGLGYVWNMAEGHDLDIYGKYIWTRVQGTDDTLTTKDKFEYDDMDSNRVRFGARYSYKGSERFSPYVGAAYEHEFSGSCDSRAYGHAVAAPSYEGDSFMGELGLTMKPSEDLPLSINLGVQGYTGQKQGISGSASFVYEF